MPSCPPRYSFANPTACLQRNASFLISKNVGLNPQKAKFPACAGGSGVKHGADVSRSVAYKSCHFQNLRRITSKSGNRSANYSCAMQYARIIHYADAKSMAHARLMVPMPSRYGSVCIRQLNGDN